MNLLEKGGLNFYTKCMRLRALMHMLESNLGVNILSMSLSQKLLSIGLSLLLMLALVPFQSVAANDNLVAPAVSNLLLNADFADAPVVAANGADKWNITGNGQADRIAGSGGDTILKLSGVGDQWSFRQWIDDTSHTPIKLNTDYAVGAWVKLADNSPVDSADLYFSFNDDKYSSNDFSVSYPSGWPVAASVTKGSWQYVKLQNKITAYHGSGASKAIEFMMQLANGSAVLLVDRVDLIEGTMADLVPGTPPVDGAEGGGGTEQGLIQNGDFEAGLAPWQNWGGAAIVDGVGVGGSKALKLSGALQSIGAGYTDLKLEPNTQYRIAFRQKTTGASIKAFQVSFVPAEGGDSVEAASKTFANAGSSYEEVTSLFTIPGSIRTSGLANAQLWIGVAGTPTADDTILLDNVIIEKYVPDTSTEDIPSLATKLKELHPGLEQVGVALQAHNFFDKGTEDLIKKHFSDMVPENDYKASSILSTSNGKYSGIQYNYEAADRLFNWAKTNGLGIKVHAIAYHTAFDGVSSWFFKDENNGNANVTKAVALQRLEDYTYNVMKHAYSQPYGDVITSWEIVNEAAANNPSGGSPFFSEGDVFHDVIGDSYPVDAFRISTRVLRRLVNEQVITQAQYDKTAFLLSDGATEGNTAKIDAVHTIASQVLAADYDESNPSLGKVKFDGIGVQSHLLYTTPMSDFTYELDKFASLGLPLHITELDLSVKSIVSKPYEDLAALQAQKYKEIFDTLDSYIRAGKVKSVYFWGTTDDTSWLTFWWSQTPAVDYPLLFDKNKKAKPAYYAITGQGDQVKPVRQSTVTVTDRLASPNSTPDFDLAESVSMQGEPGLNAKFKTLYSGSSKKMYVKVDVIGSNVGNGDQITVYLDTSNDKGPFDAMHDIKQTMTVDLAANAVKTQDGYTTVLEVPLGTNAVLQKTMGFDIKVVSGTKKISWNDTQFTQDTSKDNYGTTILKPTVRAYYGTPSVDGTVDEKWDAIAANAYEIKGGNPASEGSFKVMWDDNFLYTLTTVKDSVLNEASLNAYEQDSVEVFLDQNNHKTAGFEPDDNQYRISYTNQVSLNKPEPKDIISAAKVVPGGYVVEAKIPWNRNAIIPGNGVLVGADFQINDADASGARVGYWTWYDHTGMGWQGTSVYGTILLTGKTPPAPAAPETPSGLTVVNPTSGTLTVQWTSSEEAAAYKLYRDTSASGDFAQLVYTGAEHAYTDSRLSPGTTYYYKVAAVNAGGESGKSQAASGTTAAAPPVQGSGDQPVPSPATPATLVPVVKADLGKAVKEASDNKAILQVKLPAGATEAIIDFSAQELASDAANRLDAVIVQTDLARFTLSPARFKGLIQSQSAHVQILVSKKGAESLPASAKEMLGNQPVYEFNLTIDGVKVPAFPDKSIIVELPYALGAGQTPQRIVVYSIGDDGKLEVVKNGTYAESTGMIIFRPKHFSKYAAVPVDVFFSDLSKAKWAQPSIEFLAARGIVSGFGDHTFKPDGKVTRAQWVQMLMQALDASANDRHATFTDVKEGAWYAEAMASAEQLGVVKGRQDGSFGPNERVSREEMAVMLYRASQASGIKLDSVTNTSNFSDHDRISGYADEAVQALSGAGLINGVGDGSFMPHGYATRAEAAAMLERLLMLANRV